MISAITSQNNKIRSFLKAGLKFYLAFLLIFISGSALILIWGAITLLPITLLNNMLFEAQITEPQLFLFFLISGTLFTLGFALIFNWSVISRIAFVKNEGHVIRCMGNALRDIFRNFPMGIILFLLFILVQVSLILAYWGIEDVLGMRSEVLVILFFLIQQTFVFARIFWRMMLYGSIKYLYRRN